MSSHQAPLFIKIKHANSTRKVRVPHQPAPVWSKLSAAISDRFGIPKEQPIGLEYIDPEGDSITISSQVEFDELWPEITPAAKPSQKGGVDQRTLSLELVLIDHQSSQPTQPSHRTKGPHTEVGSTTAAAPTTHHDPTKIEGNYPIKQKNESIPSAQASDPPEYPISTSPSPNSQAPLADPSLGLSALITAIDAIAPKLQDTLGGYAQMIVQVTDQLSDTCRVIASHLQDPAAHTGSTPRATPLGERFPSARPTFPPHPPSSPPRTSFGFASHSSGPTGPSDTALPCNSPLDHPWYTRAATRSNIPVPDYSMIRQNSFLNPPFRPVSPRLPNKSHLVGHFGNPQAKDRCSPSIFCPHNSDKTLFGADLPDEAYEGYRSVFLETEKANKSHTLPDDAHNGVAGFGDVRGKGRNSPTSIFAKNSPTPKGNIRFGGAGIDKREQEWPSFKPMFPNLNTCGQADKGRLPCKSLFEAPGVGSNPPIFFPRDSVSNLHGKSSFGAVIPDEVFSAHPVLARNSPNTGKVQFGKAKSKLGGVNASRLANQGNFGCLGQENARRQSPASSSSPPTLFSPPNHPEKKQSFSDDDSCGWPKPIFSDVDSLVKQATATKARVNDNGGAEKKKGSVNWVDRSNFPPALMGQTNGPNFSKPKNKSNRKHAMSFADWEDNSDSEYIGWRS